MVRIAQLVRASDCGSEGRGFESHFSPVRLSVKAAFFCLFSLVVPVWGCPKSRIAPFAIVYFGKKYYLTVAKTKHYSNG